MNTDELLKFAIESGMIDLQHIQANIDMIEKTKILNNHPYSIWQGKDGLFYTYLPDEQKGRILRKRNSKDEIERLVMNYWKELQTDPTLKEVFTEWNDRRLELKQIASGTHKRNEHIFNKHYKKYLTKKIKSVTPEWVEDFLEQQIPEFNMTAKAYSNLRTVTRGMFKRARKRKLTDLDIESVFNNIELSKNVFRKVIKEDYEEVYSETETDKMMEYLHNNLDDIRNLGVLLLFVTGLRVGELVALQKDDIEGLAIKIRHTESRIREDGKHLLIIKEYPKTDAGVRTTVVPPDYAWLLKKIKMQNPFGDYLFMRNGSRLTAEVIRTRVKSICKELDIYYKPPHKIRKTYGTILIDSNVDQRFITEQMGHTNIACTEKFYHRNRKTLDRKSQILGTIPEFKAK